MFWVYLFWSGLLFVIHLLFSLSHFSIPGDEWRGVMVGCFDLFPLDLGRKVRMLAQIDSTVKRMRGLGERGSCLLLNW